MAIIMAKRSKIAVVEIHGTIGASVKSPEIEKILNRVREDTSFRALVLDIDSGGGSASPSDYIYRAARRIAGRKPVVACIRGVGASGAYMIACAAHRIVAAPGAIVGSIGVISIRPALEQLMGTRRHRCQRQQERRVQRPRSPLARDHPRGKREDPGTH